MAPKLVHPYVDLLGSQRLPRGINYSDMDLSCIYIFRECRVPFCAFLLAMQPFSLCDMARKELGTSGVLALYFPLTVTIWQLGSCIFRLGLRDLPLDFPMYCISGKAHARKSTLPCDGRTTLFGRHAVFLRLCRAE